MLIKSIQLKLSIIFGTVIFLLGLFFIFEYENKKIGQDNLNKNNFCLELNNCYNLSITTNNNTIKPSKISRNSTILILQKSSLADFKKIASLSFNKSTQVRLPKGEYRIKFLEDGSEKEIILDDNKELLFNRGIKFID